MYSVGGGSHLPPRPRKRDECGAFHSSDLVPVAALGRGPFLRLHIVKVEIVRRWYSGVLQCSAAKERPVHRRYRTATSREDWARECVRETGPFPSKREIEE